MNTITDALIEALPVMKRSGKPRRFRQYRECFEWTFNALRKQFERERITVARKIAYADDIAGALWAHQQSHAGDFAYPR